MKNFINWFKTRSKKGHYMIKGDNGLPLWVIQPPDIVDSDEESISNKKSKRRKKNDRGNQQMGSETNSSHNKILTWNLFKDSEFIQKESCSIQPDGESSFVSKVRCYNDLSNELTEDVGRVYLFLDRRSRHEQGKSELRWLWHPSVLTDYLWICVFTFK